MSGDHCRKLRIKQIINIFYITLQVLFSCWILYEILIAGWLFDYSFFCEPIDRSNNPKALRMAAAAWYVPIS